MPNQLTTQQLTDAKIMIARGDVVGFYDYMYSQGYGYANLAKGVVECSLPSGGATALQYMTDVAKQAGINLTTQQVAKIEIGMANGYVDTLLAMANAPTANGRVSQDINGDQALSFHKDVLRVNGLPYEAWTLYTPSQYLSKEQFNADFAASIAPGANIMNSGKWALDMALAANAYEAAQGVGFSSSANVKALNDINGWIVKVTQGTAAAAVDAASQTETISGCQVGVQQVITQLQQDAASKQSQTPTDAATRTSSNYITDTSANDHLVQIKSGGTVWDAFVSQQNSANGFKNWADFKTAVAASNPDIADLNHISAGSNLYLPEKFADGSITYNFAGGTAINSNATTGEYHMVVQNADGGQTVYSRNADADAGYVVHQVTTDRAGNITNEYNGHQATLDSDIKPISADWKTSTESGQTEWNTDNSYDTTVTNATTHIDTTTQYQANGDAVGSFKTEHQTSTAASNDLLATKLQTLLDQNTSHDSQVLEASEIRAVAGAQGKDEAWGGGRMLDVSDSHLGDYYWTNEHSSATDAPLATDTNTHGLGLVDGFDMGFASNHLMWQDVA